MTKGADVIVTRFTNVSGRVVRADQVTVDCPRLLTDADGVTAKLNVFFTSAN